jgi:amino acid adenylation domain-containing protein
MSQREKLPSHRSRRLPNAHEENETALGLFPARRENWALAAGRPLPNPLNLSFAQERLWFLNQFEPDNVAYHRSAHLRLRGQLDPTALERSLHEIIRRHDALRTTFPTVDGLPVVRVAEATVFTLGVEDLSHLPQDRRREESQRRAAEESRRPFDLANGPLLRVSLLRLDEQEHLLLIAAHQIVFDEVSIAFFHQELAALYAAFAAGEPIDRGEPPASYLDYARRQREWAGAGGVSPLSDFQTHLAYWRERLRGAPAVLELPTGRPRPPVQTFAGAREALPLPTDLSEKLERLSRREKATLFMTLLAGFQTLLHRYTGQEDICVGSPVPGRNCARGEGLIGLFVNHLVLRGDLSGQPTFRELLGRVRETVLEAYDHQDVPFEKLVEELQPQRDRSRTPLFQFAFRLRKEAREPLELPGLIMEDFPVESDTSLLDMSLEVIKAGDGLCCVAEYNTDLFDRDAVRRLLGHYQVLLEGAAADPDQPIGELPLLTPAEQQLLLVDWQGPKPAAVKPATLPQRFEAQAERTPDAVAVVCDERQLTYRELNLRSGQLAQYLRGRGVGPETLVGICIERSLDMVVGLLGILKAGGAYVPLDPAYPRERINFVLEDARVALLLTQEKLLAWPEHQAKVICLDRDWDAIAADPVRPMDSGLSPDNLAYVIYTSGSTGKPKGVQIEHRAVINFLDSMRREPGLTEQDTLLAVTTLSFDIAGLEIFLPLTTGAKLVIAGQEVAADGARLARLLSDCQATVMQATPATWRLLLDAGWAGDRRLKILCGGEALPRGLARELLPRCGSLWNMYGPTETTIWSALHRVEERDGPVPIGRPIADTEVFVLDARRQLLPVGVPGELYIGGAGLARGYLHRPELTAEKFIAHPFRTEAGARLYRTGDLVRWLPTGELEWLARVDQQVKVRGFRIELGEVEAVLGQHPAVRECVVVALEDGPNDKRLVAYLAARQEPAPSVAELREHLQRQLPAYMVPALFVVLPELPRMPNGKVDRRALPAPDRARAAAQETYVAPRTALEHFLAETLQTVLGLDRIGVHDNFFELGMDSLEGAVVINKLQEKLGQVLFVVALYDAPTVAEMVVYLSKNYAEAVVRAFGRESLHDPDGHYVRRAGPIDAAQVAYLRQLIAEAPFTAIDKPAVKNPPMVFLISPPRSGSTLLRVMLAGHPRLFSPPELELLAFATLQERRAAFRGRYSLWLEGTVRALMEIYGCDGDAAKRRMEELEAQGLSVPEFYRRLQEAIGPRMLVDKTTSYALDPRTLQRAEDCFENALYLHLLRHPAAMVCSFEEARLDQVFFRPKHPYSSRELAELVWVVSHQNTLEFLKCVPAHRQHVVRFEELVKQPRPVLEGIARFLGLEFDEGMLQPYQDKRMTDGVHAASKMMGDFKFKEHGQINAQVADRWKEAGEVVLGDVTCELAAALGYEVPGHSPHRNGRPVAAGPQRELTAIARLPRDGSPLPLSFAQQRLWFLHQLEPGSPAYNVPAAYLLKGPLDRAVLEECLAEVVRRQEALRTTFTTRDGLPVQVIAPAAAPPHPQPLSPIRMGERGRGEGAPPLAVTDLRSLPAAQREEEARRQAVEEFRTPFDLERGPLLRVRLLQLADEEHWLLLSMHHIISDWWSRGVLLAELAALYTARTTGRPAPLPELPVQYADFAAWQRQWLRGEVLDRQLDYWKKQLAGAATLDLPTDRPRPPVQTFNGARRPFALPADLIEKLQAVSRGEKATLFMTLLAGFQTLLHRYTGQDDICVGSPIANRTRAETENLVGFFVNSLVLRADLGGNPTFRELLGRVREAALGAYAHQDLPFEQLVEVLQPPRDLSRPPLFQVMFALQNTPVSPPAVPGLHVQALDIDNGTAKFDLTVFLFETGQGLKGEVQYNTDLFDAATIERLTGHFRTLLEGAAANPESRIGELPLLTEPERRRMLVEWNDTRADYPREKCFHQLFEEQAERTPGAVAAACGAARLTYAELNRRANQLAHYLRSFGIGPEVLVGVCMERSLEMLVGILGVLKAGGAYLPLDPSYPPERLRFMVQDGGVPLLLTQERLRDRLTDDGPPLICLDTDWDSIAACSDANPEPAAAPENLAYVIYTSGSTGKPKGTTIPHRGLVNYLCYATRAYDMAAGVGAPVHSSIAFDLTITGLFGPLVVGRRVELLPEDEVGVEVLCKALRERGDFSVIKITPAHLELLGRQLGPQEAAGRTRAFIIGGEQLTAEHIAFWQQHAPQTALVNEYGPTETVVGCCVYWTPLGKHATGAIPIGKPIANTQLYVLDRYLQPLPVGVPGELFIGGDGVGRGYLHRPELTAEKFVADPFRAEPNARLYRTGDLARWLPDGNLEFLGRIDHQVKIRGFRVELGEIEAEISQHPGVREAVVLAREDTPGDRRLVAYVVPAQADGLTAAALRDFLKAKLPDYMVPAAFVLLPELPLTPNGKVDRKALPAPDRADSAAPKVLVPPRNAVESRLVAIWEELLETRPVGVTDNFFELGGHSLLVVDLFARMQKEFGQSLPLAVLFEGATVEHLAGVLGQRKTSWSPLVELQPHGDRPPLFLVHSIGGDVICYAELARHIGADQPLYGLQKDVSMKAEGVKLSIAGMAARYLEEVCRVQPKGPYHLGGYSSGGTIAFEMAQQLRAQGEEVGLVAILDHRPLALLDQRACWRPGHLIDFLRNLPWWVVDDLLHAGFGEIAERFRIKLKALKKKLAARFGWPGAGPALRGVDEYFDVDRLPANFRRFVHEHHRALLAYDTRPYPGRVTVFLARAQPLFRARGRDGGWGPFAAGGVQVVITPGNHDSMLREPHVRTLARQLRACMISPSPQE